MVSLLEPIDDCCDISQSMSHPSPPRSTMARFARTKRC